MRPSASRDGSSTSSPAAGRSIGRAKSTALRGEFAAAEEAYRRASRCGYEPQPGLGAFAPGRGQGVGCRRRDPARRRRDDAAAATRAGFCRPTSRSCSPSADLARRACAPSSWTRSQGITGAEVLGAMAAPARGAVALASGDPLGGAGRSAGGSDVWQELGAPYEVARTRVSVGLACRALRDEDTAVLELEAAREIFSQLGARPDLARVDGCCYERLPQRRLRAQRAELEVLRLVAAGPATARSPPRLSSASTPSPAICRTSSASSAFPPARAASAFAVAHELV